VKHIQQQNSELLKTIAKIEREGGLVKPHWDEIFMTGWSECLLRRV